MTHCMNLWDDSFQAIKEGWKTVEMRLNDEKRSIISAGDIIEFTNITTQEKMSCKVMNIYKYSDFAELYKHHDKISIGYKEDETANPDDMLLYYTREDIEKYGAVGIEVAVNSNIKETLNIRILGVKEPTEKQLISGTILEALPDWFGIPEAREQYIKESADQPFFAAYDSDQPIGFLCLKETGKETVELSVMGVLKDYHRKGIGRKLFEQAREKAKQAGYSFMQVKTVQMGRYEDYDATNHFYLSLGFKEFEVFPTLWDEWNPCQIYVMAL